MVMTTQETAAYVRVSYWKILDLVRRNEIPHFRIGRKVMFRKETVDAWLGEKEAS